MTPPRLHFHPIDLVHHADLAVAFRRDSYICSFGTDSSFVEQDGANGHGYLDWLRARLATFPQGHVHVWRGSEVIGQIEMLVGPTSGYVNLFYLKTDARGLGLGTALHDYAVDLLQRGRVLIARLRVSPTNLRAVRFYERHGWTARGPSPGGDNVHLMELPLPSLSK